MKRMFDLSVAVLLLVFLSPVFVLIAILVWLTLGRPVLFTQWRPGKGGRLFRMYKFRTMTDALGAGGTPLPDDQRMTPVGKFLRSASLDELPELWNVVIGEMSLVGPRPLLPEYLPLYSREQARRHDVLPGITGWAQVNGRNAIDWDEKFRLDVWYVDHRSFRLDLLILWRTLVGLLTRQGISAVGSATMPKFDGQR